MSWQPFEDLNLQGFKPSWVFLDLDNTLWDFDGNAEEALHVLFQRHAIEEHTGATAEDFVRVYNRINHEYWARYERGEVSKEVLRSARFTDSFRELNYPESLIPDGIWKEYLDICPVLTRLMPGARDFVEAIAPHYKLAILTNGFEQTQQTKLACCGLGEYFDFMLSSEGLGHAKPSSLFFEAALSKAQVDAHDCLYVGDTFRTDVIGGVESGIRTAWYLREREVVQAEMEDSAEWKNWQPADSSLYLGSFQHLPQLQQTLLTGI